jgi:catechol 2,3-dioxygenase-like lactoylglutathione lyase family enzyme
LDASLESIEMVEDVVPVLRVEDAARAVDWYRRLGFEKEWEHQFEPGLPWFVSVARGDVRLYLSEHRGDAPPNTLVHLYVRNVDDIAAEFGLTIDEDGLAGRECHLDDPDGNRLRIATPRS